MAEEPSDDELKILNELFVQAAKDPEFRKKLMNDPLSVLSKYNISNETKQSILDALSGSL